jgi:hypothetical protein
VRPAGQKTCPANNSPRSTITPTTAALIAASGCWAHARRGFFEAQEECPNLAGFILLQIQHLNALEKRLKHERAGRRRKRRENLRQRQEGLGVPLTPKPEKELADYEGAATAPVANGMLRVGDSADSVYSAVDAVAGTHTSEPGVLPNTVHPPHLRITCPL